MLGVENDKSDLDLLITTYFCLYNRKQFFQALEETLIASPLASEIVVVWAANVPLAKFKVGNINVDLVFADYKTPTEKVTQDYFLDDRNICSLNQKSSECVNGLISMFKLQEIVASFDNKNPDLALEIFRCAT